MKTLYNRFIKRTLLSILIIHFSMLSFAATYYISSTGNDTNSGLTTSLPWKTIAKVNATTFAAGDQILFKKGDTFYGSFTIKQSGTSGNPIIYGAYGTGGDPIITGFTTVPSWTNLGSNIWESTNAVSTLSTCNMVVINGVNTPMGREPNTGYYYYKSHSGKTQITSNNLTGTPNWVGAELAFNNTTYTIARVPITGQSDSTLTFTPDTNDNSIQMNGLRFIIQNDIRTLNSQNEWYYNPSTKKISIYSLTQPTNVKITSTDILVSASDIQNITFQNILFEGSNRMTFLLCNAKNITIESCNLDFTGGDAVYGVWGGGTSNDFKIENCTINNSNDGGIEISGDFPNAIIRSNTISNTGMIYGTNVSPYSTGNGSGIFTGISAVGNGSLIEKNTIQNTGYIGIGFKGNNTVVQNNLVNGFCLTVTDGGGIYTWNGYYNVALSGMKVLNNIILNGTTDIGIYMDDKTNGVEVSGNTSANNHIGLYLHNTYNVTVENNATYNNDVELKILSNDPSITMSGNVIQNNNFISKTATQKSGVFDPTERIQPNITFDNNYYARPIDQNLTFILQFATPSYDYRNYTFEQWQMYSGQDVHSHKSPYTITSENDLQFEYNASSTTQTITLSRPMIDVKGTKYSTTVTLQPFTSVVLMKDMTPVVIPGAPTSVVATAGNASATVTFVAPVSNGGSAITGYTVTSIPTGGIDANAGSTLLTHIINGLTNGTSYTFTVKATNSAGTSIASAASNLVMPVAVIKQGDITPSHFTTVWQGSNGLNHMNIIVASATLEDLPLSLNDEIAVFSGSVCVGTAKLTKSIVPADNTSFLTILASQSDGSNNGFIENDTILFKVWDNMNKVEKQINGIIYRNDVATWKTTGRYIPGSTSMVEITSYKVYTQSIELLKGYNMISTYVSAQNPNASAVTKTLVDQGNLIKMQDETGNSFENWGDFGGWINQLGSLEKTEGYKIQVANNCTLQVTGRPIAMPLNISLKTGWNIISFPRTDVVNAMNVVQTLIDQNKLVKVQDEAGNSIENWGLFGGWKNGIGNFIPGKAYKVKMNVDAILTFQESYPKSALVIAKSEQTEYYNSSVEGNGTDHMNINITGLNTIGISVGDELAAFDGAVCVATIKITEANLLSGSACLASSFSTDNQNQNGFKVGDPVQILAWNKLSGDESKVNAEVITGQLKYEKNASVLVKMKSATIATGITNLDDIVKIDVFPNPCQGKITVRFSEIPNENSRIEISDISGRKLISRLVSGTSEEFNLDSFTSGLYLVKSILGSSEFVQKFIVNK